MTDLQKFKRIYWYIWLNIRYDHKEGKAITDGELKGYVPDTDEIARTHKGSCLDFAVLVKHYCNTFKIDARVCMGYCTAYGQTYHAWNEVYLNDQWRVVDITRKWGRMFKDEREYTKRR